ncbi:MAG: DUF721 domain-containing protein [Deltaproteobacteria bacterium]|nr:DUF721 domain-containing protein [Deltaproteobacteria bacterium]
MTCPRHDKKTPFSPGKGNHLPSRIGGVLGRSFTALGLAAKISEFRIKKEWDRIVGPAIAKRAQPGRLTNKTLHVLVSSSSWMNELRFHMEDIIKKVNAETGGGTVEEIVFKPGRLNEPEKERPAIKRRPLTVEERVFIEKTVSGIKDPQLRDAIKRAMEKGKGY